MDTARGASNGVTTTSACRDYVTFGAVGSGGRSVLFDPRSCCTCSLAYKYRLYPGQATHHWVYKASRTSLLRPFSLCRCQTYHFWLIWILIVPTWDWEPTLLWNVWSTPTRADHAQLVMDMWRTVSFIHAVMKRLEYAFYHAQQVTDIWGTVSSTQHPARLIDCLCQCQWLGDCPATSHGQPVPTRLVWRPT